MFSESLVLTRRLLPAFCSAHPLMRWHPSAVLPYRAGSTSTNPHLSTSVGLVLMSRSPALRRFLASEDSTVLNIPSSRKAAPVPLPASPLTAAVVLPPGPLPLPFPAPPNGTLFPRVLLPPACLPLELRTSTLEAIFPLPPEDSPPPSRPPPFSLSTASLAALLLARILFLIIRPITALAAASPVRPTPRALLRSAVDAISVGLMLVSGLRVTSSNIPARVAARRPWLTHPGEVVRGCAGGVVKRARCCSLAGVVRSPTLHVHFTRFVLNNFASYIRPAKLSAEPRTSFARGNKKLHRLAAPTWVPVALKIFFWDTGFPLSGRGVRFGAAFQLPLDLAVPPRAAGAAAGAHCVFPPPVLAF